MLKDAAMPLMDRSWEGHVGGGKLLWGQTAHFLYSVHETPRLMIWVAWKVIHAFFLILGHRLISQLDFFLKRAKDIYFKLAFGKVLIYKAVWRVGSVTLDLCEVVHNFPQSCFYVLNFNRGICIVDQQLN